jgi:hypothetical protein
MKEMKNIRDDHVSSIVSERVQRTKFLKKNDIPTGNYLILMLIYDQTQNVYNIIKNK